MAYTLGDSLRQTLKRHRSWLPIYSVEELAYKSTADMGITMRQFLTRPTLLVVAQQGSIDDIAVRFLNRACKMHGLEPVLPNYENIDMVAAQIAELNSLNGYDVRFIKVDMHFHFLAAIRQEENIQRVVGITVDTFEYEREQGEQHE